MNKHTHIDPNFLQTPLPYFAYYQIPYLKTQEYAKINVFENDHFFIPFSLNENCATSIEKSPFGSFMELEKPIKSSFATFEGEIVRAFRKDNIDKILVKHPSPIYSDFVDSSELVKVGYRELFNDVNQHILLSNDWESRIHQMQSRKLKTLHQDGFKFQKIPDKDITKVHMFLTVCRQAQGLQINISLEKFQKLNDLLPNTYELFGVFREEKLSAVCITVRVTNTIAYYYLAGTSPLFRSQSPMVLLISGMVSYFKEKGFKYLDLGASSFEGKPQETLRLFKQRMGAEETFKPTFVKYLT